MPGEPESGIQRPPPSRGDVASQRAPDLVAPDKRPVPLVPIAHAADVAPGSFSGCEQHSRPPRVPRQQD
eukprot:1382772-Alexandrium_andersonii.AAC.1